jgi:hypothetical protein
MSPMRLMVLSENSTFQIPYFLLSVFIWGHVSWRGSLLYEFVFRQPVVSYRKKSFRMWFFSIHGWSIQFEELRSSENKTMSCIFEYKFNMCPPPKMKPQTTKNSPTCCARLSKGKDHIIRYNDKMFSCFNRILRMVRLRHTALLNWT